MQKMKNTIYWAVLASETSHIFCCVLPTVFSILSLLAGLGLATVVPVWLEDLHAVLHEWELPLILLSGFVVLIGWGLYIYSKKIDCHDTGCAHGACEPRKDTANLILKVATILFIVNVSIYGVFHRGIGVFMPSAEIKVEQAHEH